MMLYIYRYTVYMLFIKGMDVVNSPLHFCWDWVWSSIGPKPPWQTAPGKVPQEACGRVDEQQVYSFHLASRVKRWMTRRTYSHLDGKRHIYIWLILCGYVSVAAPKQLLGIFTPRKWEKRLRKLRNFSQQNFWKALLRSPLPWSLPVLLGLWTCLGKDGLFFLFLTAKRRCQQNRGERKWFCLWEWMAEDLYIYIEYTYLHMILYENLTDDSQV